MSMFNLIKTEQLQARKARDAAKASILTTILGEFARSQTKDDPTDAQVFSVLTKMQGGVQESYNAAPNDTLKIELEVIAGLLANKPAGASEEEVETIVAGALLSNPAMAMGPIMGILKKSLGDRFDGKVANTVVNKLLSR